MVKKRITYKKSGVDVTKSNTTTRKIKRLVTSTYNKNVLAEFGGFGGLFQLERGGYKKPVLVSSVDGVGTKLKIAFKMDKHDTVGIDIVNHCVNDILVQGAKSLFFMDYIAMGQHETGVVKDLIKGMVKGCRENDCVLLGGEMAEMPGFYNKGEYDLAGTIVGIVEKSKIIDGTKIKSGDMLLGLQSSGLHTSGYSLARKIVFDVKKYKVSTYSRELGTTIGEALLVPHRSYARPVFTVLKKNRIKGLVHITGGGMTDNIVRILPKNCRAQIERRSWDVLPIFELLQREGGVDEREMRRAFNMGIGLIIVVSQSAVSSVISQLKHIGEKVYIIGEIRSGSKRVNYI